MNPSKGFLPATAHASGTGTAHIFVFKSFTRRRTITRVPQQLLRISDVCREASCIVPVQVVKLSKQLPLVRVLEACRQLALLVVVASCPVQALATSTM